MPSILFLSSAEICLPLFKALYEDTRFDLMGLVCQPDRAAGRGMEMKAPASKVLAEESIVPVYQPESLKKDELLLEALRVNPPDFLVTFAYGQILSQEWLDLPRIAPVNVHTSLLPLYRGASPIQSALLKGDSESGISVMKMVKKMDAGPVYAQSTVSCENMNAGQLHDALAALAAEKLPDLLMDIFNDLEPIEQSGEVSYCHKISSADSQLKFDCDFQEVMNAFRAYTPWPSLWTTWKGKRIKLLEIANGEAEVPVGQVQVLDGRIVLGLQKGSLEIKRLQMAGKKAMPAADFIRGQEDFLTSILPS